jgi:TonB family protein
MLRQLTYRRYGSAARMAAMKRMLAFMLSFVAGCCLASAQSLPEPILQTGQMPIYPPIARAARIEGDVKVAFVLNEKGDVESVDVKSGHPMLRDATAVIVKSWKFKLPNLFRTEWKYDTTFKYHLSGKELELNETAKLTIVVDSFHRIDVMSDSYKTETQVSY